MMKIFTTLVLALSLADTSIATVPEETTITEPFTWTDVEIMELLQDKTAVIPDEINDRLVDFEIVFKEDDENIVAQFKEIDDNANDGDGRALRKEIDDNANDGDGRALRGSTQGLEDEAAGTPRELGVICRWCDDVPGMMERHCSCDANNDALCRYCYAMRFDRGNLCERFCWWDYV